MSRDISFSVRKPNFKRPYKSQKKSYIPKFICYLAEHA